MLLIEHPLYIKCSLRHRIEYCKADTNTELEAYPIFVNLVK
jgi:hypothetical protein